MRVGTIYGLCDPATGELRYIGKCLVSPENRLRNHLNRARNPGKRRPTHRDLWIKKLIRAELKPVLTVLRRGVPEAELYAVEQQCILDARARGVRLTNHGDGGPGCTGCKRPPDSEETRERKRVAHLGKTPWNKGRKCTDAERENNRQAQLAYIQSHPEKLDQNRANFALATKTRYG